MANTFLPTSFTVTSTFATLASYLATVGFPDIVNSPIASQGGYIRNQDASVNLYVGFGTSAPTNSSYEIVGPKAAISFCAGLNANLVWVRSASSTVAVGFAEGSNAYLPPLVNGVIGTLTASANVIPKSDGSGNLVASSIIDDATTVTATEPIVSAHATTPYFETASGKTNTGYVNIKGKTSGAMKFLPADATAQTVTIATAAQTVGATTLTIPDQAGVSSNFVFTTLAQTLTNKTLTAPVLNAGTVGTSLVPTSDDGAALGDTTHNFSDIFLATGAVLNYANGNVAVTHSSGILTMGTGEMRITTPGTNAASVPTLGSTNTLTNKTLTAPVINGATSASGNFDLSGSNGTFKTTTGVTTLSGAVTAVGQITMAAGTTAIVPYNMPAGTLKTTPSAGDCEFDGVNMYGTVDTTSSRGSIPVEQYFRLTSTGSTISTIANYFGTTSNISLVASAFYEIDIFAWFLNTTAGTVVWTLTNSAAPTAQDIYYEMSPITGLVAPPGTATMLVGQIYNDNTAAKALAATGTLTDAVNHFMHMKIWLQNGTGTSLKIQATKSAGTITPGIGSRWFCRRLPAGNTGTFAA